MKYPKAAVKFLASVLIVNFTLFHCTNTHSKSYNQSSSDTISCDATSVTKSELVGVWGEDSLKNAAFVIKGDSIRYTEHFETPYFFDLKDGSISIHFDGFTSLWKICRVRKDSLMLLDEFGEISYYKKLK